MQVNIINCLFILDSEQNTNIRKNDIKKIKVLVDKNNNLPHIPFQKGNLKTTLKNFISNIIGSNIFHIEQVFTIENENSIDIIYLSITNIDNILKLDNNYQLIDFKVEDNNIITFGTKTYKYKTIELEENNNIEYIHNIETKNSITKKNLLYLLISYKKIRKNINNTDIIFKFMSSTFTLEEVRILYEIITQTKVDKSNFRKKIIKYCELVEDTNTTKKGYRPSQKYKFKPLKGDIWL